MSSARAEPDVRRQTTHPGRGVAADLVTGELLSRLPRCGSTRIVAIDGRSGAGKTVFADVLQRRLDAPIVALDHLYGGWDGLRAGIERLRRDVLQPLRRTGRALVPHYDWEQAVWVTPRLIVEPELLVVEGVGAAARPVRAYTALTVWLELESGLRRQRALSRDERFAPHWDGWADQEEALLADDRTPAHADLTLDETFAA